MQARAQGREWNRERKEGGNQRKEKREKHRERWLYRQRTSEDSHQGRNNEETDASTFPPSFVWQNHTKQVSSEGCKLHMGSGQAKPRIKFFDGLSLFKD